MLFPFLVQHWVLDSKSPPLCFWNSAPHPPCHPHLAPTSIPFPKTSTFYSIKDIFLPLRPDKSVLCYICAGGHGQAHVYCLVVGLVPGNSEWLGNLCCSSNGVTVPLCSPSPPPPRSLSSVWWLVPSIHICIGQLLAGSPKELPH